MSPPLLPERRALQARALPEPPALEVPEVQALPEQLGLPLLVQAVRALRVSVLLHLRRPLIRVRAPPGRPELTWVSSSSYSS